MKSSFDILEVFHVFRQCTDFDRLDDRTLLALIQLGQPAFFPSSTTIVEQANEVGHVYAWLDKIPCPLDPTMPTPCFWGLEALTGSFCSPITLTAPPDAGIHGLLFPSPRLIAVLNDAPEMLLCMIDQINPDPLTCLGS
jgi:hypothetical protein